MDLGNSGEEVPPFNIANAISHGRITLEEKFLSVTPAKHNRERSIPEEKFLLGWIANHNRERSIPEEKLLIGDDELPSGRITPEEKFLLHNGESPFWVNYPEEKFLNRLCIVPGHLVISPSYLSTILA